MRTLVLVDADQPRVGEFVRGDSDRADSPARAPGSADEAVEHPPSGRAVVVVTAMNTDSVRRWKLRFARLHRRTIAIARAVERAFGREPPAAVCMETALVLPMPEAADRALVRLVREAGTAQGEGDCDRVCLLSGDKRLRDAVQEAIETASSGAAWTKLGLDVFRLPAVGWRAPTGTVSRRQMRTDLEVGRPSGAWSPASPTIIVDSEDSAAWAARKPVQACGDLRFIADQLERRPSLLTQIGLTSVSARGVGRMVAHSSRPRGRILIGCCSADDGLELLRGRFEPAACVPNVRPEVNEWPGGVGGVRLTWDDPPKAFTGRTKLPLWLLMRFPPWNGEYLGTANAGIGDTDVLQLAAERDDGGRAGRVEVIRRRLRRRRGGAGTVRAVRQANLD